MESRHEFLNGAVPPSHQPCTAPHAACVQLNMNRMSDPGLQSQMSWADIVNPIATAKSPVCQRMHEERGLSRPPAPRSFREWLLRGIGGEPYNPASKSQMNVSDADR